MKRQKRVTLGIGLVLIVLLTIACGALQPSPTPVPTPTRGPEARAGEWRGATEFGTFSFEVSPDGQKITSFALSYSAGIESGSFEPDGEIAMPIADDGSFDLSIEEIGWVFRGRFSEGGQRASGLWEMETSTMGTLSEEWEIER